MRTVRAIERLWQDHPTHVAIGRARAVIALKYGFSLLAGGEAENASLWLEAAEGTIALSSDLQAEPTLAGMLSELRDGVGAHRADQARLTAEAAAAVEAKAMRLRLLEQDAEDRRRQRERWRLVFATAWIIASAVTYYGAYRAAPAHPAPPPIAVSDRVPAPVTDPVTAPTPARSTRPRPRRMATPAQSGRA